MSTATVAPTPVAGAEAWVAEFIAGWREPNGPQATARHFERVIDPQIRMIQPQIPDLVGIGDFRSGFIAPLFALIPDIRGEVENWATNGEQIYIELTMRGTLGGRPVSFRVCDRITLRDGLAIERESYTDPAPLLLDALRRPRAWPALARFQAALIRHRLKGRRNR